MNFKKMLAVVVVVAAAACSGSGSGGTGGGTGGTGGGSGGTGGGSGAECFTGTATTNDQLLNACVDQTVEKIEKQTPWRDPGVTLPPLP